jgi:uncharacterized membrane protein
LKVINHSFVVDGPRDVVWGILGHAEKLGRQLPYVVEVTQLDKTYSKWKIKGTMGPVTKIFNLMVTWQEITLLTKANFVGTGDGLSLQGSVLATDVDGKRTKIEVELKIEASGVIVGSLVNHLLETHLAEDLAITENRIRALVSNLTSNKLAAEG